MEPIANENTKMVQPFWKTLWQFLIKLNIHLLSNIDIPLLGIYPKEMKACPQKQQYAGI